MTAIGTVDSLWRYPVKSMRGEEITEAFFGFPGVYGDRIFAFRKSAGMKGFPWLTARDQKSMLQCAPRFRHADKAARPVCLEESQKLGPGLTPEYASATDLIVDIETPDGRTLAIDDPAILDLLRKGARDAPDLTLVQFERAMTDCRPASLISLQTVRALGEELATDLDARRFRANIYLDMPDADGFAEDELVGRTLRIGSKVTISILERDPRCAVITLDPETGKSNPEILKCVAQNHEAMAGVYGAVLVQGMVNKGDPVELLD